MASRYTASRDRSPPRHYPDRRPSATYTPSTSSYRGTSDQPPASLDRAPPRGPKADFRGGGYPYSPVSRGRGGFPSRAGDSWDRERDRDRDPRNQPPTYRRDDERGDWPRREREFAPSDRGATFTRERGGYVGRDRSASPERPRRNSKENLASTFNRAPESGSNYYPSAARGGSIRGRGRGDWERSQGRSSFVSERDREFYPRSRSRDEWRDREYERSRPPGPDAERPDRFDRREYDRPDDREPRVREHDIWQRDRSPGRNSTGRTVSPGAVSTASQHGDRYKTEYDATRKSTLSGPLTSRSEARRDNDTDYFSSRVETPRRDGPLTQPFPTPNVPQTASLGLDYGDPPPVSATTPSTQEKVFPAKQHVAKQDAPTAPTLIAPVTPVPVPVTAAAPITASTSVVLQPPSGPKADRVGPQSNISLTPRAPNQQFEPWPKQESAARSTRPDLAVNTSSPIEPLWRPGEPSADVRNPAGPAAERSLPSYIPSGPRATTSGFRGRLLSNEQTTPNAPPTAPRQPKANTLENRVVPNAPTGPRSSTFPGPSLAHKPPPTGPQAVANRQWVAPDYRPSKPSIMNQLNKPYQPDARGRSSLSGPSMRPGGVTYSSTQAKPSITRPMTAESTSPVLSAKGLGQLAETPSGAQTPMDDDMVDSPADVEMSLPASDEEDVEDDDGLDEDYFAASEETHLREMKLLESKKPLPPLLDPSTAALIIRVQLLDMIAKDVIPEAYESIKASADTAMDIDTHPTTIPLSPDNSPEGRSGLTLEHPRPRGRPLSQPLVNLIPTPPIDTLPYLNNVNEDCHVFEDSEGGYDLKATTMLLCQEFTRNAWFEASNLDDLHTFYRSKYPQWRRDVEQAEQRLREVHRPSPVPVSPAPSATPSLPPGPERGSGERTRGARNTTDLDMQQAILMSQQSAKEEEERREREAASNALPNYETEAVVPFMIKPTEIGLSYFEDINKMVDQDFALDVYGFIPPEDDFTDEEQAAFIAAYCQNPKKWGKIADSIPGRTYQDCITHYYLTKDKANYKERLRQSQPKRGRRRAAATKPRANNLISDLALNEDGEGAPVAVTDSGRPRRAAAPTFGDAPDSESASVVPAPKKLKDSIKDGDPTQSKSRGRKGAGAGKGRKAKEKPSVDSGSHLLLPASAIDGSPQKLDRTMPAKDKVVRASLKLEAIPQLDAYGTAALAAQVQHDVNKFNPGGEMPVSTVGPVVQQVTSYWSVPEVQKFPDLIQYFGRDFAAIASFLKTKSAIMIKNYFQREINNGKVELEQYARIAEEKKVRGEPLGPPPTPVQPPKRRYEATPSMAAVPRATTTNGTEHSNLEADIPVPPAKAIIEEFPSNSIQRVAGEVVVTPRPSRDVVHHSPAASQVHVKLDESIRLERTTIPSKSSQGPPRGVFQADNVPFNQPHVKPPAPVQDTSIRQRPTQMVEHRPLEVLQQQPSKQQPQQMEPQAQDFGRAVLAHSRESMAPSLQAPTVPQYQPLSDRALHHVNPAHHSRHGSLTTGARNSHEQAAADLASLHNAAYNTPVTRSPVHLTPQVMAAPSIDTQATRAAPQIIETVKPVPAKRSNVFSILNDDLPEPPVKRPSLEASKKRSIDTPPPSLSAQQSLIQPRPQDDTIRHPQSLYGPGSRTDSNRSEYRHDYSSSPATGQANEQYIDKLDPRSNKAADQRLAQASPALAQYSVVPPSSQTTPVNNVSARYDPARNLESGTVSRRSLLGISHAPSPPPQQQQQTHPHRSLSGSSQHSRGHSINYPSASTSGAPSYSHPTSSTPVSAVHPHNQQLVDNGSRPLTIQQHMAQREKEQAMHAQRREIEMMQHQQQPPPPPPAHPPQQHQLHQQQQQQQHEHQHQHQQQQHQHQQNHHHHHHHHQQQQQQQQQQLQQSQHSQQPQPQPQSQQQPISSSRTTDPRDMYNPVSEPRMPQQHHVQRPPASQTPQPQPMGMNYPPVPPRSAYTSPHNPAYAANVNMSNHLHGHLNPPPQQQQPQQQQYQPHQSHQSQYPHVATQGPSQHHQAYQPHPGYGPPSQSVPHQRNAHPLSVSAPHAQGNYRPYTEERR